MGYHTVAEEGIRAFKYSSSILSYEIPWNTFSFDPSAFVTLEEKHLKKKMEAINRYQSQKHRDYISQEFIYGLARVRGVQIKAQYAEAFEVVRWIITNKEAMVGGSQ